MSKRNLPSLRIALCFLTPLLVQGCVTQPEVDPALPAAYRIAIAPIDVPKGWVPTDHDGLRLAIADAKSFDAALIESLRRGGVASEVLPVASDRAKEARSADLILKPHLVDATFSRKGSNSGAFLSNALWFVTWAGSFPVHDRSFDAQLTVSYEVVNPSAYSPSVNHESKSEPVELTYWDRNDVFPWGLLQSLLLFPVLSVDADEPTNRSLTRLALGSVAKDLKAFLNDGYPAIARQQCAWVHISEPKNSATLSGPFGVAFEVASGREINEIRLFVDDEARARCAWISSSVGLTSVDSDQTRKLATRVVGDDEWSVQDVFPDLKLSPGTHFIRIQAVCGAAESSSTVVVHVVAKQ